MPNPSEHELVLNMAPGTLFWCEGELWQKSRYPNSECATLALKPSGCLCSISRWNRKNRKKGLVGRPLTAEEEAVWRLKSGG